MAKQKRNQSKSSNTSQNQIRKYTYQRNDCNNRLEKLETTTEEKKIVLEKNIDDCKQKYVEKTRRKQSLAGEINQQTETVKHLDITIKNMSLQVQEMKKEKEILIENNNTKISDYRMCVKYIDEEYPETLSKNKQELSELNANYKAEKKKLTQAIRYREKEIIFHEHNLRSNFNQERHEKTEQGTNEQPGQVQLLITECFAN